jgi:hypothetical protein
MCAFKTKETITILHCIRMNKFLCEKNNKKNHKKFNECYKNVGEKFPTDFFAKKNHFSKIKKFV